MGLMCALKITRSTSHTFIFNLNSYYSCILAVAIASSHLFISVLVNCSVVNPNPTSTRDVSLPRTSVMDGREDNKDPYKVHLILHKLPPET